MPITYRYDDIPDLWSIDLPREEQQRVERLQRHLGEMAGITDEAASAVALFDFARQRVAGLEELLKTSPADRIASPQKSEQELASGWQFIAARAVVLAVARLDETMTAASAAANSVPAIAALVDRGALKRSTQIFADHFCRQAEAADVALGGGEPDAITERGARGLARGAAAVSTPLDGDLLGSRLTYLQDGRLLALDISQQTLGQLVGVRDSFFAAFAQVGEKLQERSWRRKDLQQFED
jgi:hypothetical protein